MKRSQGVDTSAYGGEGVYTVLNPSFSEKKLGGRENG